MKIFIIESKEAGSPDSAWCEIATEESGESTLCFTTREVAAMYIAERCPPGFEARVAERDVDVAVVNFPDATRH